mgnify:CR=1 FL=1
MNIQIVRKQPIVPVTPSKTTTLVFKKSHLRTQRKKIPIVSMYDEEGMYLPVSLKLTQNQSKVPSTLLSRWINANCSEKLLTLKDRCNTVERIKDGVNKGWWFTNLEDSVYGLHRISIKESLHDKTVEFCVVNIDDSIGMNSVKNILTNLGISLSCEFDTVSSKMTSITLKFGGD